MARLRSFYESSVGKKTIMGITGLIGVLFVIGHAAGNLLVFQGAEAMNAYAHFLKSTGELLWIVRITLIAAVVLHIVAAVQVTARNKSARPVGYARRDPQVSTLASRSMRIGGLLLLIFIPLHIMHFTTGTIRPAGVFSATDVYSNVVLSFRIWWVTAFYVLVMAFLGLHLFHGAWSSAKTLGVAPPSPQPLKHKLALLVAMFVWTAFTIVPIAVAAGIVR
ncbi:MAG: succinate dehydrogenase cytochrome b subunit [Gemmatimonadaceae bacterium]|nr:succinate dehydrogenase cytochrome b subunit [Gemmatimonadaceae bacterium]